MSRERSLAPRVVACLLAGSAAIAVNTLALKGADWISLATAHGGLLRLVAVWFRPLLGALGAAYAWSWAGGPAVNSAMFQTGFHLTVGLVMALFYGLVLEQALPGSAWRKGLVYAAATWALNAAVVLPASGEGFAGSALLSVAGMAWFAAAHTLFFVLLAVGYAACLSVLGSGTRGASSFSEGMPG